jgi:hypothetical protein
MLSGSAPEFLEIVALSRRPRPSWQCQNEEKAPETQDQTTSIQSIIKTALHDDFQLQIRSGPFHDPFPAISGSLAFPEFLVCLFLSPVPSRRVTSVSNVIVCSTGMSSPAHSVHLPVPPFHCPPFGQAAVSEPPSYPRQLPGNLSEWFRVRVEHFFHFRCSVCVLWSQVPMPGHAARRLRRRCQSPFRPRRRVQVCRNKTDALSRD